LVNRLTTAPVVKLHTVAAGAIQYIENTGVCIPNALKIACQ